LGHIQEVTPHHFRSCITNLLVDLLMADARVIDLDTGALVEKHGHGRPCGSRNKPMDISMVASSSAVPMKRRLAIH
jgi:hypothetical protein